jgi:EAL domain-containing protein (putative c-di-GMP-specific phosphodiesterase class I)
MLKRLKCPTFQGYLFGQPVPLKEFERMVFKLSDSPQAAAKVFSGGNTAVP